MKNKIVLACVFIMIVYALTTIGVCVNPNCPTGCPPEDGGSVTLGRRPRCVKSCFISCGKFRDPTLDAKKRVTVCLGDIGEYNNYCFGGGGRRHRQHRQVLGYNRYCECKSDLARTVGSSTYNRYLNLAKQNCKRDYANPPPPSNRRSRRSSTPPRRRRRF